MLGALGIKQINVEYNSIIAIQQNKIILMRWDCFMIFSSAFEMDLLLSLFNQ